MKLAWFTPYEPISAIGQVSKLICDELLKTCEVDIFTFEQGDIISSPTPVIRYKVLNFDYRRLGDYDFIIYNLGNYAGHHREIWEVMQQYPGILLLHDQIMHNFFSQITMFPEYSGDPITGENKYLELMRTYYGEIGEAAGKSIYKAYFGEDKVRLWNSEAEFAFPLLEPMLAKATAVFSHAAFFLEKIKNIYYGPTGYAYLPHQEQSNQIKVPIPAKFNIASKALVVSTGIVHPVKRIDRVAEMLLANPDIAERIQYVVIGNYGGPYGDYLNSLARGPLKGCLHLIGYQSDDLMEAFLREAEFCINIRYPNSEVCSKSLIDQMAFGNPVIVLERDFYNEIPDGCVVKIQLENEILDLGNAFHFLLDNESTRLEIGNQASDFVKVNCTPEVYVSRFKSFLEDIPRTISSNRLVNDSIQLNRQTLKDLSFNKQNVPWVVDAVGRELSNVFSAISPKPSDRKVLGIWFGFPYVASLRREGITKFLLYMLSAMLEEYPIDCEIWVYSFNEEEINNSFSALKNEKEFNNRIRIITEKNFVEALDVPAYKRDLPFEINETLDNLADVANDYSKATCFITAIVYLDNVIGTGKPLFVPVHDLGIHVHYDDFILMDPLYKARHVDIRSRAENLARAGAIMFSESEVVRQNQVLNFVSGINAGNTAVVYFPPFIPRNLESNLLLEAEIRQKFDLKKPYIFYPTQVRPYKNVSILIEAISLLLRRNIDVNLILTGVPADVPEVDMTINRNKLYDKVICLSTVSENELFSLYRYAAAVVVPTLFEGGFPLQACEAIYMDTPLVLSDIPVVRERIEFCGMTVDDCGLELFDPQNPVECADAIERVIGNREKAIQSQMKFKEKFLSYSWQDAAAQYYKMFFGDQ